MTQTTAYTSGYYMGKTYAEASNRGIVPIPEAFYYRSDQWRLGFEEGFRVYDGKTLKGTTLSLNKKQ